jgi:DNA-binding NtrC family response regulator
MQSPELLLIVEDEAGLRESLSDLLLQDGYAVEAAASLARTRELMSARWPSLLLLDLTLPDGSGLELLEELAQEPMAPAVIVLTADKALDSAVQAVRRGAYDYLTKPFSLEVLRHRIENALEHRAARLARLVTQREGTLSRAGSQMIRLGSAAMQAVFAKVAQLSRHDSIPVLVTGETGVGKESVCRAVHDQSPRASESFIAVNCAELDGDLLRSELFGHERGAFTGAAERRAGLFELASRGTLLLDEIGELPLEVQALFLRVLEEGRFRRLGGTKEIHTGARTIAVTNKPLDELVRRGRFRQDLLFRLNAVEIHVPPLRRRPEDVRLLAEHFCRRTARSLGVESRLTPAAVDALLAYPWPGNVRELRNAVERSVLLSGGGDLTPEILGTLGPSTPETGADPESTPASELATLAELERRHVLRVLRATAGNRTRAAEILGIARSTLARKLAGREEP